MGFLTILFLGFTLALGVWFWWVVPRSAHRVTGTATFAIILIGSYATGAELLSRVKPVTMEIMARQAASAEVIAFAWDEGKAVYLWLRLPGSREPRAYVLPWSMDTVRKLQEGKEQAGEEGLMMNMPFQWSWEMRETPFYPAPQPKLPDKGAQPTPEIYRFPGQGA